MARTALVLLALGLSFGCASRYDRAPIAGAVANCKAFYACPKCGSLEGGIFGEGPTKAFRSESAARCIHEWQTVSMIQFEKLATQRFGVDWSVETGIWKPVVYDDGIDEREARIIAEDYYLT